LIHASTRPATAVVLPWLGSIPFQQLLVPEQSEDFLHRARIVALRSNRATLSDGQQTHDAHVQGVHDEASFLESYKHNVAAFRLDRILGLGMVPVAVERTLPGRTAAFTWWVDRVRMTEKQRFLARIQPPDVRAWNYQVRRVRVFQELISNTDQNLGNLLITKEWRIQITGHTRAFRAVRHLRFAEGTAGVDPDFLDSLERLEFSELDGRLRPWLNRAQVDALLARRDAILAWIEKTQLR